MNSVSNSYNELKSVPYEINKIKLDELPLEILCAIFSNFNPSDILPVSLVNKKFRSILHVRQVEQAILNKIIYPIIKRYLDQTTCKPLQVSAIALIQNYFQMAGAEELNKMTTKQKEIELEKEFVISDFPHLKNKLRKKDLKIVVLPCAIKAEAKNQQLNTFFRAYVYLLNRYDLKRLSILNKYYEKFDDFKCPLINLAEPLASIRSQSEIIKLLINYSLQKIKPVE